MDQHDLKMGAKKVNDLKKEEPRTTRTNPAITRSNATPRNNLQDEPKRARLEHPLQAIAFQRYFKHATSRPATHTRLNDHDHDHDTILYDFTTTTPPRETTAHEAPTEARPA
jgi:hypothetical protein